MKTLVQHVAVKLDVDNAYMLDKCVCSSDVMHLRT